MITLYSLSSGFMNRTGYLRLTFTNLQKKGGLGLPAFKHHYWAANSRFLPTGSVEVLKMRRTLCGYSWKLLLSKCSLFLLCSPTLTFSALAAKLIQWNFIVEKLLENTKSDKSGLPGFQCLHTCILMSKSFPFACTVRWGICCLDKERLLEL